jgi:hypothetical protein
MIGKNKTIFFLNRIFSYFFYFLSSWII